MEPPTKTPTIEANGLLKRYGDLVAVSDLDLRIESGTCLGLLGPNGAGKSTTINILVGLLRDHEGDVRILGLDWRRHGRKLREEIGVKLQETEFNDKLTVREILQLFRSFYQKGREIAEVLQIIGLEEKHDSRYVALSGGQKQRLQLGCALVNQPRILFLDEPTTGLDPQGRRRVWDVIEEFKGEGGTVLLTTHYMDEAEQLSDYVVIIDHGKSIAEGSPRQIIDSLGAESIIEFSARSKAGDKDTPPDVHLLESLPAVRAVRTVGSVASLDVEAAHRTLPALCATLDAEGMTFTDLRTHRPTLEDVFVTLTGRQLRDG